MTSRDDPRDPFEELFRELERMMNQVMRGPTEFRVGTPGDAGFGSDTHVDIYEQDDEIRVIADLPGVSKADIQLKCDGRLLTITAESDHRNYDERIELPGVVDESTARASYNNGVLEIVLERQEPSSDIRVD